MSCPVRDMNFLCVTAENVPTELSSTVNVFGGTFGKFDGVNFRDVTTSAFTLIGSNLMTPSIGTNSIFGGTDYALSGTLQGGTNLRGYVLNVASGAQMFTLQAAPAAAVTPKPTNIAFLIGLATTGTGLLSPPQGYPKHRVARCSGFPAHAK